MFVREKRIGAYTYVYLVENVREGGKTKQRIIKNLGRKEAVEAGGDLDRLARSAARLAQRSMILSLLDDGTVPELSCIRRTQKGRKVRTVVSRARAGRTARKKGYRRQRSAGAWLRRPEPQHSPNCPHRSYPEIPPRFGVRVNRTDQRVYDPKLSPPCQRSLSDCGTSVTWFC